MVVTGEGKVTAIPDVAKISAGVADSGKNLASVEDSVNKKAKILTDALKKAGINENDIKTSSYNINPQSDYQANPPVITGYQVTTNYEVTIRNINNVNQVLSVITGSGANLIGGVSFDLSDDYQTKMMNEARNKAVEAAKTKAQGLAKASGVTLGKVINVAETPTTPNIRPLMATEKTDTGTSTLPSIQPGQAELSVSVSLSYEIR